MNYYIPSFNEERWKFDIKNRTNEEIILMKLSTSFRYRGIITVK